MTRTHSVLVAALVVLATVASPLGTALAAAQAQPDQPDIVTYGGVDEQPSYIVTLTDDNDSFGDLQDWANDTESASVIRVSNASNTAVVAAPGYKVNNLGVWDRVSSLNIDVILGGDGGLDRKEFIRSVSPNYEMSTPDPVFLKSESDWSPPEMPTQAKLSGPGAQYSVFGTDYPTQGIGFAEDAPQTTPAEARDVMGVDNVSVTGNSVTVAPIDSGCAVDDGQYMGNGSAGSDIRVVNESKSFLTNTTVENGSYDAVSDSNTHGTWVTHAMAANTSNDTYDGVLPDADVLCLKTMDSDGQGSTADITRAVRYAIDYHQNNSGQTVISMSLGSPLWNDALADAVVDARDAGVIVVVAAGNSAQTRSPGIASPADASNVITAGAVTGDPAQNASRAYFSQYGPDPGTLDNSGGASEGEGVDLVAPGMNTTVQTPLGNLTKSGTSMATPYVAAAAGAVMEAHPDWTPEDIEQQLYASARRVPNVSVEAAGHGMVAPDRAINQTETNQTQEEAMNGPAEDRSDLYDHLADAQGGFIARTANRVAL